MAKAKKKTLPKDFRELLEKGDVAQLKAVFDTCEVDARVSYGDKETALAFFACPPELARWLVAQGADIAAVDIHGNTPLHKHAGSFRGLLPLLIELGADVNAPTGSGATALHLAAENQNASNARMLIEAGAKVDAPNRSGMTPLEVALYSASNARLELAAELADCLLDAGAQKTPRMREAVERLGKNFEFHRKNFNPKSVEAASAALDRLYEVFGATAAPRRKTYDGKSPIVVANGDWQQQHQALWDLLVPSSGAASTVQGEVIRVSGRIIDELDRNGGGNWDADYRKMADAFLVYIRMGEQLPDDELALADELVANAKKLAGDPRRMAQVAVNWVRRNPLPIALAKPGYRR